MSSVVSLILDVVILGVLAATILYARRLSRQFAEMKADRKIFEKLIEAINSAASRADIATRNLREAAQQGGDALQDKINAARSLADELEIVIEAGDNLAGRLEGLARRNPSAPAAASKSARAAATISPRDAASISPREFAETLFSRDDAPEKPLRGHAPGQPRSRAEKELLEALRAKQQSS